MTLFERMVVLAHAPGDDNKTRLARESAQQVIDDMVRLHLVTPEELV